MGNFGQLFEWQKGGGQSPTSSRSFKASASRDDFSLSSGSPTARLTLSKNPQSSTTSNALDSVVGPDLVLATSFAAARGPVSAISNGFLKNGLQPSSSGNLTGNGFSLAHHTFGIIFCGQGFQIDGVWHGGDGPCPFNIPATNFSYIPAIDDNNTSCPNNTGFACTLDFSHDYPQWADTIKVQALKSYQAAFDHLPAIVAKQQPTQLNGGPNTVTSFDHTIYVRGDWVPLGVFPRNQLPSPPSGFTPGNLTGSTGGSFVYYLPVMSQAQTELGSQNPVDGQPYQYLRPSYPPATSQAMADFRKLVTGIGMAIGNVGAHETGHQLNVPYIECDSSTCENQNIHLYQYGTTDTWSFTGYPKMTWGTAGQCWIENYLLPGSCKPQ